MSGPCFCLFVWGAEPPASHMLGKYSALSAIPSPGCDLARSYYVMPVLAPVLDQVFGCQNDSVLFLVTQA